MNLNRIAQILALATATTLFGADSWSKLDTKELAVKASSAKTADEHHEVAREYEARAAAFENKAKQHETEAEKMKKRPGYEIYRSKWPAMVQGPIDRERAQALQARRAARESLELVAKHRDLAAKASAIAVED